MYDTKTVSYISFRNLILDCKKHAQLWVMLTSINNFFYIENKYKGCKNKY